MLRVRTKLEFSELHGIGVFALEPIKKGQLVIRHHPDFDFVFYDADMEKLPVAMREAIEYYGYRYERGGFFIYNVDNERFLNHSESPNLRPGRRVMFAARDIEPDEELTVDYRTFCDDCAKEGIANIFRKGHAFTESDPLRGEG
ncbi:hypothetical protein CKO15_08070 [Halorhodospira abdelmalekii]|uniref:SET domain-containing protein n=1 Tax=Halorhodospira abdelmalekii TaxID=421629 RepID=UPI001908EDE4|nr:SET domain-containing protein-lysine N-methyltransferase [Halorhodospira abdelmalekii]MBK1735241.1 hypothetical protein [Halorhodospira abdelmalekii]